MTRLATAFVLILLTILHLNCNQNAMPPSHLSKSPNALINETSPYLLQHAYNPVKWEAWHPEVLKRAKKENKLLIISIGYAACHWCHVMEHESFEDSTIAKFMNENFIAVKVDREERPDIDDIYMSAVQLISGNGGWPLNAIALPDGRPVYAVTYLPPKKWLDFLQYFISEHKANPDKLEKQAEQITLQINQLDLLPLVSEEQDFTSSELSSSLDNLAESIDSKHGGRKGAPKFPMPINFEAFLYGAQRFQKQEYVDLTFLTLDKMCRGGIYDQIGGGFARYSTDEEWLAPHFEKMLYDNGQLLSLYAAAYKINPKNEYKFIMHQTVDFLERELKSPEGGFYSSIDADSEGEEGKFYVWSQEEYAQATGKWDSIMPDFYDVSKEGNWEGKNILRRLSSWEEYLDNNPDLVPRFDKNLYTINGMLLKKREERVRPRLDDKILTSWNGLVISGLLDTYSATGDKNHLLLALNALDYILKMNLNPEGKLTRNTKNNKSSINGFLDDYANLIQACRKAYHITLKQQYLDYGNKMIQHCFQHFFDQQSRMFFYTSDLDPALVARKFELSDNVIPGANSVLARELNYYGILEDNPDWQKAAQQMANNMKATALKTPSFYSNWIILMMELAQPPLEIVIMGKDAVSMGNKLLEKHIPQALISGDIKENNKSLMQFKFVEGENMIYVCKNKTCQRPVNNIKSALLQIQKELNLNSDFTE